MAWLILAGVRLSLGVWGAAVLRPYMGIAGMGSLNRLRMRLADHS
jgi:hypothetical protein